MSLPHSVSRNSIHCRGAAAAGSYGNGTLVAFQNRGSCGSSFRRRTSSRPFAQDTISPSYAWPSSHDGIDTVSGR
jgi:hypothetical protein